MERLKVEGSVMSEKKVPRLLIVSPLRNDAVSSWRCLGPLGKLAKAGRIEIVIPPADAGWVDLTTVDMLMMHRPFAPQHVQFMAMAKQYKLPIYVDYDDDLLNVMDDNPTYHNYGRQEVKDSVRKCLQLADKCSVTTEELKQLYLPYCADITIIPNALDDRFITYREKTVMSNAVWWRGSDSHQRDLMSNRPGIIEAYRATQDKYSWNFIGYRPWFMLDHMPKAVFHPGRDFKLFYDVLCDANPDVMHVPLHDHPFNKSKSMIAAMEGSMAGACIVAPNWTEWQIPGVAHYNSPEDYGKVLTEVINLPEAEKRSRREATAKWFLEHRTLDQMNELRMVIIESLVK
jgi:O-antigen biosynthesis protein